MPVNIEFVRSQLLNRDLRYFDSIDTTMREAAALAAAGAATGTTVIAEEQTAGQGRHGHAWHSEHGAGLYCSILLPRETSPTLTMALGLAVAEAVTASTHLICDLRWPNDVMIGNKKVAGILAHLVDNAAIAGIGVNVNHAAFPAALAEEATSLRLESGRDQSDRKSVVRERV